VPWLLLTAGGYTIALNLVGQHAATLPDTLIGLREMIQTLGVFNLLMFAICAWFTWGQKTAVAQN
jgi:hypothetical protein